MRRIFFLVPNIISSTKIVEELHRENIHNKYIHVVGNDPAMLEKAHLHEASLLQTTDIIHALLMGILFGSIIGLVLGLLIMNFPPNGLQIGWPIVLGISIFGALFGAWVSSLIGISVEDPIIERFHRGIALGQLLMIVDIPVQREKEIKAKILHHHPEASIESLKLKHNKCLQFLAKAVNSVKK